MILTVVAVVVFLTKPAYAYLDPGGGSIVLQMLLCAFAAVAVVLKTYWNKIVSLFRGSRKGNGGLSGK